MAFSSFVGNQTVIAEAKREFKAARVVLVVSAPSGGKTTFVRCLEKHFEHDLRFVRPDLDSGDTKSTLWSIASRKSGVMEAFASGLPFDDVRSRRDLRIVLDDVDVSERGLSAMIEELILGTPRSVGVIMVLDAAGLRKMSQLKKKGALVLVLSPPGKDAVQRWARRELLGADATEEEHARLRAVLRACNNSISRARKAFEEHRSAKDVAEDVRALGADDADNATTIAKLFKSPLSVEWLMGAVCLDGGSMLGQLAWHNASAFMDEGYAPALKASLAGMALERSAHLRHDQPGSALGHALSLAPYADIATQVDRSAMTYTTTMAHGGARAVARRALATTVIDERSVAERAWDACQKPAGKPRKRAGLKKKEPAL